jgi:hypothetical protein
MYTLTKTLFSLAVVGSIFTSCGRNNSENKNDDKESDKIAEKDSDNLKGSNEICKCLNYMLEQEKEMIESRKEEENFTKEFSGKTDLSEQEMKESEEFYKKQSKKREDIAKKHADKKEKCRKLGEGKSQDELEKMEEEAKNCPAYKEMEKLREER